MSQLLQMYRGDTFAFTRTVLDDAGQPVDLSMADVVFTAKRRFNDAPFLRKTIGDGIDLGGSGDSELTVTLEPADTAALTATERFVWDIQYDDLMTMAVRTPFIGRLVVRLDVGDMAASGSGSGS